MGQAGRREFSNRVIYEDCIELHVLDTSCWLKCRPALPAGMQTCVSVLLLCISNGSI